MRRSPPHDFGAGLVGNQLTEQALNDAPFFTLWWSNPLGGANDDYDLFLLDNTLTNVVAFSANVQDGDDDPLEAINSVGIDHTGNRLVITKFSGADQFLQLNTHRGILQAGTDGQITGHAGAEGAFAVAAVNVSTASGGPFVGGAANPVEPFSSDGPRRIFFNPDGSPVVVTAAGPRGDSARGPSFITRNKPDISAADGVMTTTPGFTTFFGTSASVPHGAGLLALLKQLDTNLTSEELRQFFSTAALDIETPGFDRDSGHGIFDAQNAAELASRSSRTVSSRETPRRGATPCRRRSGDRARSLHDKIGSTRKISGSVYV
ncbi:MAG: S8 family serine peptidase [Thermoanaerobaculia bacterium]|nr:S8 family serine peptidase [Thermoanaerobaculia bacterium]